MSLPPRVVWSEGMHLAQHHFQAQTRYFEGLASFLASSLLFRPYGLAGCEMDAEALRNGVVALVHARGVLPDGLAFQFPLDPLPAPLDIREIFSPTQESHLVLLALPRYRPGQANVDAGNGAGRLRYSPRAEAAADEVAGQDEREILLAGKNFRLLLDEQLDDSLVALPLARVRRDGTGHFRYDPEYVPPCLQIGASEHLLEMVGRVLELLDAKAESLRAQRQQRHASTAEYASQEVAGFWLAHAIHASYAPLRHLLQTRVSHPEQLFLEMSGLAGALCTFALEAHPGELPAYDHDDLGGCFAALERSIRGHLDVVLPTRALSVPLAPAEEFVYTGEIADRRAFGRAHWYLGVRSTAMQGELIARVPALAKFCSAKFIGRLIKEAYPGLALEHVPVPPPELAPRIGTQYFRIQREGPCWASIVDSGGIGLYVPAALPVTEVELVVVLEA